MITVTLHGKHGTRAIAIKPKGFGTRHVRVRREINPPVQTHLKRPTIVTIVGRLQNRRSMACFGFQSPQFRSAPFWQLSTN